MSDKEYFCGPCLQEATQTQAVVECFECSEKLCEQCKKFHQRLKSLSGHTLYDIVDGPKDLVKLGELRSMTECPEHNANVVRYICKDHDQVCCEDCAVIKHRKCDHMILLVDEIASLEDIGQETNARLDHIATSLDKLIDYEMQQQTSAKASINQAEEKLLTVRNILDEAFHKLKERITDEVSKQRKNILEKSKTQVRLAYALKREVDTSRSHLNVALENGDKIQVYLMERAMKNELRQHEKALQRLAKHPTECYIDVVEDISEQALYRSSSSCFHIEEKTIQNDELFQSDTDPFLIFEEKITVPRNDARKCIWIENFIVLTLPEGMQLQLYHVDNGKLQFKESKITSSKPLSVCLVENSSFAVCYSKVKSIEIMNIYEGSLQHIQTIKTEKEVLDIFFDRTKSEMIGLSRSGTLDFYKLNGTLLRSVTLMTNIVFALKKACSISFDMNTRVLYISSNGLHKILSVKSNGEIIFEYSCPRLKSPWFLDIDANGNIWVPFFCEEDGTGILHQLDRKGKLLRKVKITGQCFCVRFDESKSTFLVLAMTRDRNYFIQFYSLRMEH